MQIFKKPNFTFMKYKFFAFALSGIIIAVGIVNITAKKGLNYGIDFAGGTLIQIRFRNPFSIADLRQSLSNVDLGNSKIQEVEKGQREFIIRTMLPEEDVDQELEAHVIMGNKVVETLKNDEDRLASEKGLKDLNDIEMNQLTYIFQSSFHHI